MHHFFLAKRSSTWEGMIVKRVASLLAVVSVSLFLATPSLATPVSVTGTNAAQCDSLSFGPTTGDEFGLAPAFPTDERISSSDTGTTFFSCITGDTVGNILLTITNLTGADISELYYVADPETTITNYDGFINGELAFRIDHLGSNLPLISESMAFDNIFEAGETWDFILQDYINTGALAASALGSIGVPSGGVSTSSGSIVTPEPSTLALLTLGLMGLTWRRWRR